MDIFHSSHFSDDNLLNIIARQSIVPGPCYKCHMTPCRVSSRVFTGINFCQNCCDILTLWHWLTHSKWGDKRKVSDWARNARPATDWKITKPPDWWDELAAITDPAFPPNNSSNAITDRKSLFIIEICRQEGAVHLINIFPSL